MKKLSKPWLALGIGLILALGGGLLASWIQAGEGTVTVNEVKFYGTYSGIYDAYLFVPKTLTTGRTAPAILAIHGYNNSKEYMNNTALELARRGYVVLSMDLDKHGLSGSSRVPKVALNAYGALDGLRYLRSLDVVDLNNVGLIGMSMGGYAIEGAAQAIPDGYKSLFFMDSSPSVIEKDRNVAISWGLGSEVPQPFGAKNGSQVQNMPAAMAAFGTDKPIIPGQVYGSIADGTARVLYTHFGDHPYSTDDPVSIGNAVRWFGMTLSGAAGAGLLPENQIWQQKLVGTSIGLVGLVIFMIALGALLLRAPYFASLNEKTPEYKGFNGAAWWIGAAFTAFLGPLTLYDLFLFFFQKNYFHLEGITTGFIGWMLVLGLISIAVLVGGYFAFGRKNNGLSMGLTWEGAGIEWGKIGRSFLLALIVVVLGYLVLSLVNSWLLVDFRFWIVTLKVASSQQFLMMLAYIIPALIYYIPLSASLHGSLRPNNGMASVAFESIVNVLILVVGIGCVLAYFYIPLEFFGAPATFGPGGLGLINGLALIVLLPIVAVVSTFFFRKTGHVYLGAFINAMFIVWYLVAANASFAFGG